MIRRTPKVTFLWQNRLHVQKQDDFDLKSIVWLPDLRLVGVRPPDALLFRTVAAFQPKR